MFTTKVFGEVPYESLHYDGAAHPYTTEKLYLNINGVVFGDSELPLQPINIDGARTLVPLREVFETLGATVNFNGESNTVTIIEGSNKVVVMVGETTVYKRSCSWNGYCTKICSFGR